MKTHKSWSYRPYRPPFIDCGEIYICRVAPSEAQITFDWLGGDDCEYSAYIRERNKGSFTLSGKTNCCSFTFTGLCPESEYEFYVCSGEKHSKTRLARCGNVPGTTVNYLHPDDGAYDFSGRFLCSPSLVRHPDGYLLASMDLFASGYPQNLTLIYRSDDDGKSWSYVSELFPCFWGKMFISGGKLYMLACSTEYGDLLIGCSDDGGYNFSEPTVLLRGGNGKNGEAGVHKNPQPVVEFGGRIWNTLEWGAWRRGYHAAMVMSAKLGSDLLNSESWSFSEPVKYNPDWDGVPKGESTGNIEGCLIARGDSLYNIMRYDMSKLERRFGLAVAYSVDTRNPEAPLRYSHCIEFPGNYSKFVIKFCPATGRYYSIICRIRGEDNTGDRNLLSLMESENLESWSVVCDIADRTDCSPREVGFQYVDFIIENRTILYLCRTALNHANNFHNSNYSLFGTIEL